MIEYQYHCCYCGEQWGGVYRVNDPVCRKCGSEGDYYVKARRVEMNNLYYEDQDGREKNTASKGAGDGPDDGERESHPSDSYLFAD